MFVRYRTTREDALKGTLEQRICGRKSTNRVFPTCNTRTARIAFAWLCSSVPGRVQGQNS